MDLKSPKILVSILHYGSLSDTINTIRSFKLQSYKNYNIQIIDNCSNTFDEDLIKKDIKKIKIIRLKKNKGYAGGNNLAIELAIRGNYHHLLICNNDIEVNNNLLSNLVEASVNNPKAGLIGVVEEVYFSNDIRTIGGFGFNTITGKGNWEKTTKHKLKKYIEVDYVQGALMMITHIGLNHHIQFDEKLFLYYEEVDIQFLLKEKKLKAIVCSNNKVKHKGIPYKYDLMQGYYLQRNRMYLIKKHGNQFQILLSFFYFFIFELPTKLFFRSIHGNFKFAIACIYGFIDGLKNRMYKCDIEYLNNKS